MSATSGIGIPSTSCTLASWIANVATLPTYLSISSWSSSGDDAVMRRRRPSTHHPMRQCASPAVATMRQARRGHGSPPSATVLRRSTKLSWAVRTFTCRLAFAGVYASSSAVPSYDGAKLERNSERSWTGGRVHHATVKPPQANDTSCTDSATSSPYGSWTFRSDELTTEKFRLARATPVGGLPDHELCALCTSGRPELGFLAMRPASGKKLFSKEGRPVSKDVTTALKSPPVVCGLG
ncbi:hypothetical protein EJB05_22406, partial [Eragrostis curvula]